MAKANMVCPFCKKRFSTWSRKATKDKTLVDKELWELIQKKFPDQVKLRMDGLEDDEDYFPPVAIHNFEEQGAIKEEFDKQLEEQRREQEEERRYYSTAGGREEGGGEKKGGREDAPGGAGS